MKHKKVCSQVKGERKNKKKRRKMEPPFSVKLRHRGQDAGKVSCVVKRKKKDIKTTVSFLFLKFECNNKKFQSQECPKAELIVYGILPLSAPFFGGLIYQTHLLRLLSFALSAMIRKLRVTKGYLFGFAQEIRQRARVGAWRIVDSPLPESSPSKPHPAGTTDAT